MLLLLCAALLAGGCGTPTQSADCDQLLGEERYERVLEVCRSPFHRASAHLGLAGFNFFNLIDSTEPPGFVVDLLGITADNITEKRLRLILAVEEVRFAATGDDGFALLVAAYLGLAVTMVEYLDNGAGGGTALDDIFHPDEVAAATGMDTPATDPTLSSALDPVLAGSIVEDGNEPYYQVNVGGMAFNITCADADPTMCDGIGGAVLVYADANGLGLLDTVTPPFPVAAPAALSAADPAGLVVMITNLNFPIAIDSGKVARMDNFLGAGDPALEFAIGVTGYLDLIDVGTAALITSGGTGSVEGLTDEIDAGRGRIDNGAECLGTVGSIMDLWFAIYSAAPGTLAQPLPDLTDFTNFNTVDNAPIDAAGITFPGGLNPAAFVFPKDLGFKTLFPTPTHGGGFDLANATPHIANANAAFQTDFEDIPRLAPAAATVLDGQISFAEVLCSATP